MYFKVKANYLYSYYSTHNDYGINMCPPENRCS